MKRATQLIILTAVGVFMILFIGCDDDADEESSATRPLPEGLSDDHNDGDASDGDEVAACTADEEAIDEIMSRMSVRDMVAQCYVVGVQVTPWFDITNAFRFIHDLGIGGVIVQAGTTVGLRPEWTVEAINKLQEYALSRDPAVPLLVATDQEGGVAQTVCNITGGTDMPGNMALGAAFDPAATGRAYAVMADQLHELGINNPYAPVLDIMPGPEEVSMYTRCFGEDADLIADNAVEAVRADVERHIIATAKHFPGHGTAPGDEHAGLTVNDSTEAEIRARELVPFQAAIDAGVPMIMTTHAAYTAWGEGIPTTFNPALVTGVLRDEIGFDGVVMTDDINMGAVTLTPTDEHPDILAFAAGHDILLDVAGDDQPPYGIDPANAGWTWKLDEQIDLVTQTVFDGRLSLSDVERSVRRILRVKMNACLFDEPFRRTKGLRKRINTDAQIAESFDLHQDALTRVVDSPALPLDADDNIYSASVGPLQEEMYPGAFWGNGGATSLFWEMRKLDPDLRGGLFDLRPSVTEINAILAELASDPPEVVVLGTYNANAYEEQSALVNAVIELGIPVAVVALAMPYDILAFSDVDAYLATYSNRDLAVINAAAALYGRAEARGRLPVTIPGLFDAGWSADGDR